MRGRQLAILLVIALMMAGPLSAHDLFMKLDSYFVPSNSKVQVALLNGTFDASEGAVKQNRARSIDIVRAGIMDSAKGVSWTEKGDTAHLTFRASRAGTYVLGVSLLPRTISLPGDQFNDYLEEEELAATVEKRREEGQLADSAHERYSKHVKAIIQAGDARTSGWNKRLGYPAELVPMANPYETVVGDTLRFTALVDGKPVSGINVLAGYQRNGSAPVKAGTATADSAGGVAIPISASGRWYVKFISMREISSGKLNYESKWATLTFEIR